MPVFLFCSTKQMITAICCVFVFWIFIFANFSTVNCFQYWQRLAPIPEDAVRLGSDCKSTLQCLLYISNSQCNWDQRKCECQSYHIANSNNTCLPGVLLTFECLVDAQCELRVPNSRCSNNKCICKDNHIKIRLDKCLPPTTIDGYCLNDDMCIKQDPYSHCKWIVPRAYGKCKCLTDHYYSPNDQRCYPRLGHKCHKSSDCEQTTKYSKCGSSTDRLNTMVVVKASVRKQHKNQPLHSKPKYYYQNLLSLPIGHNHSPTIRFTNSGRTSYRSASRQSKLSKDFTNLISTGSDFSGVCRCVIGYRENEQKKNCQMIETKKVDDDDILSTVLTASATSINEKYEKPFYFQMSPSIFNSYNSSFGQVSIGKKCKNSFECKSRDPHSHCVRGVCHCIKRSSKCSAQQTGCPYSTFQCDDGDCVSWYFVCDKHNHCNDQSDETGCIRYRCPKEAFQCSDGWCVSRGVICDGKKDCLDGTDELGCESGDSCPEHSFRCKNGQCLPNYTFCNKVLDCKDHSDEDEKICESSKQCPANTFQCKNKKCRSTAILCSGVAGCSDHSDEDQCYACFCDKPD